MTKFHSYSLCVLAIGLAMTGCVNKEKQLVGKWKYKSIEMPPNLANSPGAAAAEQMLSKSTINFTADKKFTMVVGVPVEGNWTFADSTATMTPTSTMGMSMDQLKAAVRTQPDADAKLKAMEQPTVATLSDDGKTLVVKGKGNKDGSVTFEKDGS